MKTIRANSNQMEAVYFPYVVLASPSLIESFKGTLVAAEGIVDTFAKNIFLKSYCHSTFLGETLKIRKNDVLITL